MCKIWKEVKNKFITACVTGMITEEVDSVGRCSTVHIDGSVSVFYHYVKCLCDF